MSEEDLARQKNEIRAELKARAEAEMARRAAGAEPRKLEHFPSGAVRDSQKGKGRYDLISPLALHRLALVCEKGAETYAPRNWEAGMDLSRIICSAQRHLAQGLAGEADEDHFAHAMWNCMAALHILEMIQRGRLPKELDDRPDFTKKVGPV